MTAPTRRKRPSGVYFQTVKLTPITRCEPPEGQTCPLRNGTAGMYHSQAKQHARENPGHYVIREQVTRTSFVVEADE